MVLVMLNMDIYYSNINLRNILSQPPVNSKVKVIEEISLSSDSETENETEVRIGTIILLYGCAATIQVTLDINISIGKN